MGGVKEAQKGGICVCTFTHTYVYIIMTHLHYCMAKTIIL